ncbi:MAG: Holliday junction branch migration protein RuvA [Fibrobacteres bacterium]|nr:Holliday junction branch migration protein RuvA [Fibrobacterota bacterium]
MIERIRGKLLEKGASFIVVDCGGVGYGLHITLPTYETLPEEGASVELYSHLVVREDIMQLYGFAERVERDAFLMLTSVSKIGPKTALATLSGISVAGFVRAVKQADVTALTKVPGIGKQTAERLVVELKNKIDRISGSDLVESDGKPASGNMGKNFDDAILALESLGYKSFNADKAVRKVYGEKGGALPVEEIIKFALKHV